MQKSLILSALVSITLAAAVFGQAAPIQQPLKIDRLKTHQASQLRLPLNNPASLLVNIPTQEGDLPLEMKLFSMRADNFKVLVDEGDGQLHETAAPPVRTYRGRVANVPGSRVSASLINGRLWATIYRPGKDTLFVEPVESLLPDLPGDSRHVIYRRSDVKPSGLICGNLDGILPIQNPLDDAGFAVPQAGEPAAAGGAADATPPSDAEAQAEGGVAGTSISIVKIAMDADFEFFQKNSSSVTSTVNDIENVFNDVDGLYTNDAQIAYEITTIVVRSSSDDPYTEFDSDLLLCEFRNTWNSLPESDIDRNLAQLYTGKNMTGTTIGLAWNGVVCNTGNFNACDGTFGRIDYNIVESKFLFATFKERIALSAHEIGHNWSAPHCDDAADCHIMCSVIDQCDGVNGVNDLVIESVTVDTITSYKNSVSCDKLLPDPITPPFIDNFPLGSLSSSKWIYNDGGLVSTAATNEPSATASVNLDSGADLYEDDQIRTNFILLGNASSGASVSYWTQHKGVEAGKTLLIDYLDPDDHWVNLNTITSDGVDQTNFEFWEHFVAATELSDRFRLRIRVDGSQSNDDWYIDDVNVSALVPPGNDDCSGATPVTVGVNAWSNIAATNSSGVPSACVVFNKDVWYTFAYPSACSGTVTISMCDQNPPVTADTELAAYTGSCAGLTQVACNNNSACGSPALITFTGNPGVTYIIRVGLVGSAAPTVGVFSISISQADADNDGTPDCSDGCPNDPNKTSPGACGCGVPDTDSDGDGVPNCIDGCPNDPNKTSPGSCGCGVPDTDSDNDGTPNCSDGCPNDPNKTSPGACGCGVPDTDSDLDGTPDCVDGCPNDPNKTSPGACGCGVPDTDSDNDGTPNCLDGCPNDPNKTNPGSCGCGVPDTDTDLDGTPDCVDGCPNDPNKTDPGLCGCGVPDTDSDLDGTPDCVDGCPNDPNKTDPGACGCGILDSDSDADGTPDCIDGCPNDPAKIQPGACGCGVPDNDSDNDGVPDCFDGCPNDPGKTDPGDCGCGVPETDSDSDGTPDCIDGCPNDPGKTSPGACGCGVPDTDSDGDGVPNCIDGCPNDPGKTSPGPCGCGVPESDSDGDGVPNCIDGCPNDPGKTSPGSCGCGVSEVDSDGDGVADCIDQCPGFDDLIDRNENGIPDGCEGTPCIGDIDGSGAVDGADLGLLLSAWGTDDAQADLDGSGTVDGADLGLLLSAWGACP